MLLQTTLLLLNLNLLASSLVDDQPYCSLRYRRLCQGKGSHVACQYPVAGPGPLCRNYSRIKFTSKLRHFITNYINRRRQRIASGHEHVRGGASIPKPDIMMLVTWDGELAHLAERLADQCEFAHDDCRATVRYPYAGQSVGEVRWRVPTGSEDLTFQRAIRRVFDAWWGEKRRVKPEQLITPFKPAVKGTVWGHFSQLAVWTLRAVGCGAVSHGHRNIRLLLVCDFSHTNMLGQKTINSGPLAACPTRTVRKGRTAYPLLCAPVRRPISPIYDKSDDDYDINDSGNEMIEWKGNYHKETKQTSRPITSGIHLQNYIESTQIYYNDYDSEEFKVAASPDRKHVNLLLTHHPSTEMSITNVKEYLGKKPYYAEFRDNTERVSEVASRKFTTYGDDQNKLEYFRKSTRVSEKEPIVRHKWNNIKKKPERPGATALLKKTPEKLQRPTSRPFLMLDQDDLDQFFRDTGFHVNWRKKPSES